MVRLKSSASLRQWHRARRVAQLTGQDVEQAGRRARVACLTSYAQGMLLKAASSARDVRRQAVKDARTIDDTMITQGTVGAAKGRAATFSQIAVSASRVHEGRLEKASKMEEEAKGDPGVSKHAALLRYPDYNREAESPIDVFELDGQVMPSQLYEDVPDILGALIVIMTGSLPHSWPKVIEAMDAVHEQIADVRRQISETDAGDEEVEVDSKLQAAAERLKCEDRGRIVARMRACDAPTGAIDLVARALEVLKYRKRRVRVCVLASGADL